MDKNNRRQFLKKSIITLGSTLFLTPILSNDGKQPLYLVKGKVIDSFLYKDIEFKYYGEKQCKIGNTIIVKENENINYFGKNPYVSTFEITEHKHIGYHFVEFEIA